MHPEGVKESNDRVLGDSRIDGIPTDSKRNYDSQKDTEGASVPAEAGGAPGLTPVVGSWPPRRRMG